MIKNNPQLNQNKCKKYPSIKFHLGDCFAIREGLLRINKGVIIENENGYHFQMVILSHHSQLFLTIRTQSTTIPILARLNLLYIYKKGKCVESLKVTRKHVDRSE